jgi:DNA gyrase subunit B
MKLNDILKNREIAAIIAAVGTGVGADCDVSSMRYGRVSVLVDADVDGSHIATLLATLFWRTMRSVIEEGRFFVARPPLYLIKNKSGKESRYAYSEQDREDIEREFGGARTTSLQRYKGLGEMNPDQLRETVFVIPDEISEKKKKHKGKTKEVTATGERELTAADFSSRDLRMVIEDFHRTRSLITRLMGTEVAPRKEWLMNVDWSAED